MTPTPGPAAEATSTLLERRLESIGNELVAASGGASLCAISRSAGSVPGVKYLEGRMAATREIRRAVRAGRSFAEVLEERTNAWRTELVRTEDSSMGIDWRAYRAGGVDELEALHSMLEG
jgi:hypothetical protein